MKRVLSVFITVALVFCFFACSEKAPDADVLSPEELEEILGDMDLGEKVDLDDYSDSQKDQIQNELDKDGFTVNDDGVLAPKDPIPEEDLNHIVNDALQNGEVDLDDYDEAQKEQIKDKLEESGMTTEPEDDKESEDDKKPEEEGKTPVVPLPELSDKELAEILKAYGIEEGKTLEDDFVVEIDLSDYNKKQKEQIKAAAALFGLQYKEENGKETFSMMTVHIDEVKPNEFE